MYEGGDEEMSAVERVCCGEGVMWRGCGVERV